MIERDRDMGFLSFPPFCSLLGRSLVAKRTKKSVRKSVCRTKSLPRGVTIAGVVYDSFDLKVRPCKEFRQEPETIGCFDGVRRRAMAPFCSAQKSNTRPVGRNAGPYVGHCRALRGLKVPVDSLKGPPEVNGSGKV